MFIERIRENYGVNESIFAQDIISLFPEYTKAYTYRFIKKMEMEGKIIKYSRGVYYLPKKSEFGNSIFTSSMVADAKYITDGSSIYGIYAGLSLLNTFGISTQIPNVIEIITNNEATRKRYICINDMKYILRKSRFKITKDNYQYYSLLQLFLELDNISNLDNCVKNNIKQYIKENNININILINLSTYFPPQTLKNLIMSEVLDGFTQK